MRRSLIQNLLPLKSLVSSSARRLAAVVLLLAASSYVVLLIARADNTPQTIPFSQNWSNTGLITANDNWSGVAGIEGYLGQDITTGTGADPQTLLTTSAVANDLDVIANQSNPNALATGGVAEFDGIANPTIALNGSGTADAPYILLYLNTTGQSNINISYNLRDLDGSTDNAIMPVALQYRVGASGNFTNVPAGFVADATTGPSLATLVTPVSVTLPAAVNNQPLVQVRIITANAVGNDEWVGIDDISVTTGLSTSTVIISSLNPSFTTAPNNSVTFTATVTSGGNPITTGSVTFTDTTDATTLCGNVALNGSGQALCANSFTTEGAHNIVATYNPAAGFVTSNGSVTQTVNNQTVVNPGNNFCNTGAIATPNSAFIAINNAPARPYPSNIFVSGLVGTIGNATVSINGLTHPNPDDIDILLVGPGGQKVILMSDAGGSNAASNINLTFDDNAASSLPDSTALSNGAFKPSDYAPADTFPAPAPASPYASTLASFNGTSPNGQWSLFVVDDTTSSVGSISGGWCLTFAINTNPVGVGAANPSTVAVGAQTLLTVTVTPGANPISTGLMVTGDLSSIGGSATQQFFDNGANGDVTAGDNIFSYLATVANATTAGAKTLPFSITDAQARSGSGSIALTVLGITLIHDIQGNTETPNFVGQVRAIRGVVVGDFQGSANLNGFFVQEEDADADANLATSEGIFIFDPGMLVNVNAGDNVTVTGTVTNFGGPPGLTQLASLASVVVNSSGNSLPAAAAPSLPAPTSLAADLERFEGMRVTFNQTLFVTDNEVLGRFGELTLSANSPLPIPTNSIDPNDNPASGNSISGNSNVAAVTAQQTVNNNNQIVLNDGKTGSNPNPIPFIGAGTNATVRRGDSIANLSGILSFGFNVYRIDPATLALSFTASNPRTAAPGSVGGALRVASFNVENFFITTNPASGYRGPNNATEFTRKRDKVVAALAGLNADVIGLIELEKATTNGSAAANLAAALTTAMGGGANTYAAISDPATLFGTDPDIKSGIIYRTSAVTPVGGVLNDTAAPAGTYSRDPITQTFQQISTGEKFTIVVNHFRSKSCGGGAPGDADQGDGQACFNERRRSQAQALLTFITNTLIPIDPDVLVVGDLNAYGQEDPIDVFRAAGYSDTIGQFVAAPSQYSFTFNGEAGRLDHVFATSSLSAKITGATIWHINADEPEVFDYNTEFKTDDRYAPSPFRSADHDPILIGLNLFTPITISGQKFNDLDGDGVKDAGEPGVQGVTINLDLGANGSVDAATTTDANGNYSFTNLGPGNYRIREVAPAGSAQTTANPPDIAAQSGVNVAGIDFGNFTCASLTINPATIPGAFKGSPYSQTFTNAAGAAVTWSLTGGLPSGLNFNAATATISGTPGVTGVFNFTVRATFAPGCFGERGYTLAVNSVNGSIGDPVVCNGPGSTVTVTATVTNNGAVPQASAFTATLDPTLGALRALPGTCSANTGSCSVVNASTVTWTGTLNAGQTVTITYQAQVADGVATGTQVCVNSTASIGGSVVGSVKACATINCQAIGPGALPQATSPMSDQRAGSVLIYNLYTSSASSPNGQNTRINITNIEPSRAAVVHLFFVDGSSCSVADSYVCLTPNQTATFLASDLDPGTTGYIVAVAVDQKGCPVNFNYLIGDEYVKFASGHAANLGAEAVTAIAGGLPFCNENSSSALLPFDGVSYSLLPRTLALDNIPSRADGADTLLVLNRIGGSLATSASTLSSIFGVFYDDAETGVSFTFNPGVCQFRSSVTNNFPRITPRFEQFVPSGRSGWLKLYSLNDQAILGAAINFNGNSAAGAGAFNQGHNLHKLTLTTSAVYTIPVFPPNC